MRTIFETPGWTDFIGSKFDLSPQVISVGADDPSGMRAQITVFLNKRGKIRMPQLMPYLPISFSTTETSSPSRISSQWQTASMELAEAMDNYGYGGAISFAPETPDVRAWQWRGHQAHVRYTYYLSLPHNLGAATSAVRRNIKKANKVGYTCSITQDIDEVLHCLSESERRQGFAYGINRRDLLDLRTALGSGSCRFYVARTNDNVIAATRIMLHTPGGRAIDWVSGTDSEHLNSGVTQMLINFALEDLHAAGAEGFDFEGANIRPVARAKMDWGATLVPFYALRPNSVRTLAQDMQRWAIATRQKLRGRS